MSTLTITAETDADALQGMTVVDGTWGRIDIRTTGDHYDLCGVQGVMIAGWFHPRETFEVGHLGILCLPYGTELQTV